MSQRTSNGAPSNRSSGNDLVACEDAHSYLERDEIKEYLGTASSEDPRRTEADTIGRGRRRFMKLGAATMAAVTFPIGALSSPSAAYEARRDAAWPKHWRPPLDRSLRVNTNHGALGTSCAGVDTSNYYTHYVEGVGKHYGLDLEARAGDKVYSIGAGMVLHVGRLWGAGSGGVVVVEHFSNDGKPFRVAYAHVVPLKSPISGMVFRQGDVVYKNFKLGSIAPSKAIEKYWGSNFQPHLHFGTEWGNYNALNWEKQGKFEWGSTTSCAGPSQSRTTNPEVFLANKRPTSISGNIVGWKNSDASIASWLVRWDGRRLRRNWIPDEATYHSLVAAGALDLGARPARFLDQMEDERGVHANK